MNDTEGMIRHLQDQMNWWRAMADETRSIKIALFAAGIMRGLAMAIEEYKARTVEIVGVE